MAEVEAPTPEAPDDQPAVELNQWEFIDRVPELSEVLDLLQTLPDVWGVSAVDFADYVVGLPSTKQVQVRHTPDGPKVKEYHDVVTLYMSVGGRLRMIQTAAELNGWRLDFEPEPVTPSGVPGMIQMNDRIVYREYVVVTNKDGRCLGRRPGTAWVPSTGGSAAAGSNPYEKVETSARGRAIAAWGFGVLPGSGVASLEEMVGSAQNRAALATIDPEVASQTARMSREEIIEEVLVVAERVRQARGIETEEMSEKIAEYATKNLGVKAVLKEGTVDWSKFKDGQLVLTLNQLKQTLVKITDAEAPV